MARSSQHPSEEEKHGHAEPAAHGLLQVDVSRLPGLQLGRVPAEMMLNGVSGQIIEVWDDDVYQAFDDIRTQMQGTENEGWSVIGIDTEFCRKDGTLDPRPRGPPIGAEAHYQQARQIVDEGNLVQVGMAFGNSEDSCSAIYQFNLQFNASSRHTMSPSIVFLRDTAKLDLDRHYTRGIVPSTFFLLLTESGLLNNINISWITYQGYADFGYLIRGLEDIAALPNDRTQFLLLVYKYFPRTIDLKIFHMRGICCNAPVRGVRGSASFQSLASGLKVERLGRAHGAGSDAHLTVLCYNAMVVSNPLAASLISEYRNTVYGVEEAIPRAPEDSEMTYIEVWAANWNSQSKLMNDMFQSDTCRAVGLADHQIISTGPVPYHTARVLIEGLAGPVKIGFAGSDLYGGICFRRIWILNLEGTSKDLSHIRYDQLATMLTQASALCNPGILWCFSSSFAQLCMLKALTTSRCLPMSLEGSYQIHNAFFPYSAVVPTRSTEKRVGHISVATLRSYSYNPASALAPLSGFC